MGLQKKNYKKKKGKKRGKKKSEDAQKKKPLRPVSLASGWQRRQEEKKMLIFTCKWLLFVIFFASFLGLLSLFFCVRVLSFEKVTV